MTESTQVPQSKRLSYLSPTSFMMWRENPIKFWMAYLAPPELKLPRGPQTPPMAVGNVFDTHVKYHLAQSTGQELPVDMLEKTTEARFLGRKASPIKEDQLVLWEGLRAYHYYRDSPAMRLMLEGVTSVEVPMEGTRHIDVDGRRVPIWGKPDAELWRRRRVIMDWKVQGAFNVNRPNPEAGHNYQFVQRVVDGEARWIDMGPSHRSIEPLEMLSERWAIQCAMYAWMLGEEPGTDFGVEIHKVVLYSQSEIEILVWRNQVGAHFQKRIAQELALCWSKVEKDEILPPELRGAPPALLMTMAG